MYLLVRQTGRQLLKDFFHCHLKRQLLFYIVSTSTLAAHLKQTLLCICSWFYAVAGSLMGWSYNAYFPSSQFPAMRPLRPRIDFLTFHNIQRLSRDTTAIDKLRTPVLTLYLIILAMSCENMLPTCYTCSFSFMSSDKLASIDWLWMLSFNHPQYYFEPDNHPLECSTLQLQRRRQSSLTLPNHLVVQFLRERL